MLRAGSLLIGAVVIAAFMVGCGGSVINQAAAERFVEGDLESAGVPIESVSCESDVEAVEGEEFECVAIDDRQERAIVTMKIVDEDGGVRTDSIRLDEAADPGRPLD